MGFRAERRPQLTDLQYNGVKNHSATIACVFPLTLPRSLPDNRRRRLAQQSTRRAGWQGGFASPTGEPSLVNNPGPPEVR